MRMHLAGIGIAAALLASTSAQAGWKQYEFKDLGIFKDFPVQPVRTTDTYKAALAKEAPAVVLTAMDEGITYKVTVVDFTKRANEGANLMMEAVSHEMGGRGAKYVVTDFPLWDKGANSVWGIAAVIDKNDKDKTHILEDVVFNKGKLYLISASVPADSPGRSSFGLARFMDTSQFHLEGYGFNYETGHDYPLGDDDPNDRDSKGPAANYKPPPGLKSGPLKDGYPE